MLWASPSKRGVGVYGGHTHLKNCEKMHELRWFYIMVLHYYECVLREFMLLGLWLACEHVY